MLTITDRFVADIYAFSKKEFSEEVYAQAKSCLLDYLGATLAGRVLSVDKTSALLQLLQEIEGKGTFPIVGATETAMLTHAMLLNGMHAHAAELDDGHRIAMMHPGAPIFSALLPIIHGKEAEGKQFLKAVITGYEASIRIACTLQPDLKDKGFHGTGIAGTIGVAMALATVFDCDEKQFKDILSAATTAASGTLNVIKDISELKPYNVASAAVNGYLAYVMGKAGFSGPRESLGGKLGFLQMYCHQVKDQFLKFSPEDVPMIMGIYRKPYAACRHCHPAIEAALKIRERLDGNVQNIKEAHVTTYYWAVGGHEHTEIVGVNSAKMSTPYSVAIALFSGKAGIAQFTETYIADPQVVQLTKKVKVTEDKELTALVPGKRAAIVKVETTDGKVLEERVDYPKGEPENPLSQAEVEEKYKELALTAGQTEAEMQQVIHAVRHIETSLKELYNNN